VIRTTPRSALAALTLVAGLAAGLVAVTAVPAAAEEAPAVSWSVSPADASGPDGRVAVEHAIDPGADVQDAFAVRNLGAEEVTFRLAAADGFYNRNGRFDMLPSDQASVAAGTWIDVPETVTVPPSGMVVVPFTITVPGNAEPGDHAAGIAASVLSVKTGDGAGVGVESRVGFRVMTRVTGELAPAYAVTNVAADYQTSWNPIRPGSIDVSFDVVNEGNTRLEVAGVLEIAGRSIAFPAETDHPQEVLPGETRSFSVAVDQVWPTFAVPGRIVLSPSVTTASGDETTVDSSSTDVLVWAVPWPQLLLLLGIVLIVMSLLWRRGRSKRRLDTMLEEAREEGRRDVVLEGRR